ncbi:hypothetical protein Agub_g8850 [Astrephomene gubernaculifera]|uniref:PhoD-like phosphatase metallophosphatase domain-containing protein n=1 Tax=Astrephomene gubernaculifera TaxID=47775 RepID=A0AAD3DSC0_9CHLO|nr:hypothetical protein Agub_g8850 [Astrephomene gubernaculifera]
MSVFETDRLYASDDVYALHSVPLGRNAKRSKRIKLYALVGVGIASCVSLALALTAIGLSKQTQKDITSLSKSDDSQQQVGFRPTRRIAFGSCTSYDLRPQPVWAEGVIPAQPDAWIWLGDMAYLDSSPISCSTPGVAQLTAWCNCSNGHIAYPGQCLAGDVEAARERWQHAIHSPEYRTFLDFMCPPSSSGAVEATTATGSEGGFGAAPGRFPPTGTDPSVCPRPIFGVYDDHDYGWNNGNRRLPNKAEFKRMYLDAVGEAPASKRRSADAGLQAVYTLNGGAAGRDIDLVLLDERWYRDPLPCSLRRSWCEQVLTQPVHTAFGWCRDFLLDDGTTGRGSCCTKDDDLAAWCALPGSRNSPLWSVACDPTSSSWASRPLVLAADNTSLLTADERLWDDASSVQALWPRLLQAHDSPVCEVLGAAQRSWLSRHLAASRAALTLVASGSVLLGNLNWTNPEEGACSGDEWSCWRPAQLNLLHTLSNVSSGCVVVLTGDFHFGDIKHVAPGVAAAGGGGGGGGGGGSGSGRAAYVDTLQATKLKKHVYQVMASGMTDSTAHAAGAPCVGSYREDSSGLRPLGNCSYMDRPNFGMVEVDWEQGVVHLTIRDANGGGIATGLDGKQQHLAFSLDTCAPI